MFIQYMQKQLLRRIFYWFIEINDIICEEHKDENLLIKL